MARKKKAEINLNRNLKSPKNSRFIAEHIVAFIRSEKYVLLAALSGAFFFCLMVYATVQLSHAVAYQQYIQAQRGKAAKERAFWEGVVKDRPEYRDGYFMLAQSEYQLGNTKEAKRNIEKALAIDPNFKEGKEFKELLEK